MATSRMQGSQPTPAEVSADDDMTSNLEGVEAIRQHIEQQLEAADTQRAELLAVAVHDLRNSLGVVLVTAPMLARELNQPHQLEQLAALRRAGTEMTQILEDLVDGARIDSGTLDVEDGAIEPVEVLREAIGAARVAVGDRLVIVEENVPPGLPQVRMARHRFLRVFSRLVADAARFLPKSATLTIEVVPEGQSLRFSLTDSGPTIPEAQRCYAFSKRSPPGQRSSRGTGLGMFVVKGIVEAYGGQVEVVSDDGRGNRVSFTLPA